MPYELTPGKKSQFFFSRPDQPVGSDNMPREITNQGSPGRRDATAAAGKREKFNFAGGTPTPVKGNQFEQYIEQYKAYKAIDTPEKARDQARKEGILEETMKDEDLLSHYQGTSRQLYLLLIAMVNKKPRKKAEEKTSNQPEGQP